MQYTKSNDNLMHQIINFYLGPFYYLKYEIYNDAQIRKY